METTVTTTKTAPKHDKTQAATAPASVSNPIADKAKEIDAIRTKADQEAQAFLSQVSALMGEGAGLGNLALDALAVHLGKSANKMGRPSESAYLAFSLAVAGRKTTIERRSDLAKKANSAVTEGFKPVAALKAKANHNTGSASYRLNMPVSVEVALGE